MTDEILLYFARFLCGSTLLLATVWFLERSGVIKNFQLRAWLWKLAIVGSLVLLLPFSLAPVAPSPLSIPIPIKSGNNTAELTTNENPATITSNRNAVLEISGASRNNTAIPAETINQPVLENNARLAQPASDDFSLPPINPYLLALLTWILISGVALMRLTTGYRRGIRSLGTRQKLATDSKPYQLLVDLCGKAKINNIPTLTSTPATATPITLLNHEICLPEWADESVAKGELNSLLAHELGHVKNRDLLTLLFAQIVCRLFFFQPLFFLARNRLVDLSEFLADQWALDQCHSSDDVANALLNCATKVRQQHNPDWALAMTGRSSRLKSRIEAILRNGGNAIANLTWPRKTVVAVSVMAIVLMLPQFKYSYAQSTDQILPAEQQAAELEAKKQQLEQELADATARQEAQVRQQESMEQKAIQQLEIKQRMLAEKQEQAKNQAYELERLKNQIAQYTSNDLDKKRDQLQRQQAELEQQIDALNEKQEALAKEAEEKGAVLGAAQEAIELLGKNPDEQSIATIQNLEQQLVTLAQDDSTAMYVRTNNGNSHAKWRQNQRVEEVFWRGEIGVNDEETEITSLDRGGYFNYSQRGFFPIRELSVQIESGEIVYQYKVDGQEIEFTETEKDWLHGVLVRFFRITGVDAEARVKRLLDQGGVDSVVTELPFINSDSSFRRYATTLVEMESLSDQQFTQVLSSSDSVSSDSEMRRMLLAIIEHASVSGNRWDPVLKAALSISSDSEMRRLLETVVETNSNLNTEQWNFFLMAANTISSDSEARRLLETTANKSDVLTENYRTFFDVANTISSDSELRRLLSQEKLLAQLNADHWSHYFAVAGSISSDSEMGSLFRDVIDKANLSDKAWKQLLSLIDAAISSNSEKGRTLKQAAKALPDDNDEIKNLYNNTVRNISSKSERESLTLL